MKRFGWRLVKYPELWGLTAAALLTRFWQIGQPNAIVFDEVYFRKFASNYLDGHYFFDIHPPLVKLLFAGVGGLFGLTPEQVASGDEATATLRILPALAGALLVPLVYIIIRQFGMGRRIAALGGLFILFDNALLVESRFVLMDSLLLLFGMAAISCYLVLRKVKGSRRLIWAVAMAVCLGALVSTKWTGLAIASLLAFAWVFDSVRSRVKWRQVFGEAITVISIVAAIYVGCFAMHFALLSHSGDGDAFMTQRFQSTLTGSPYYNPSTQMSFMDKFLELNHQMYASQSTVGDHPYASRWYSWPLMIRTVYYWQGQTESNGNQGNIYLLGNPVLWWGSTAAVAITLVLLAVRRYIFGKYLYAALFLVAGYLVNFVPFMFISRSMFVYHYLFALLFAIMITCLLLLLVLNWQARQFGKKSAMQVYWAIVISVALSFIYFLPLSYGWPLSPAELQQHMWLTSWR